MLNGLSNVLNCMRTKPILLKLKTRKTDQSAIVRHTFYATYDTSSQGIYFTILRFYVFMISDM